MTTATAEISGAKKAALLLVQLGTERAARILQVLEDDEIEAVIAEVSNLEGVDGEMVSSVLTELVQHLERPTAPNGTGPAFARKVLSSGLGPERASELIDRISPAFRQLLDLPVERAAAVLALEQPQTVALILSRIDPERSLRLFREMTAERQADVAYRMAAMEPPTPAVLAAVEAGINRRIAATGPGSGSRPQRADRTDALVELLARADAETEALVLAKIAELDADLASQLKLKLFAFEDLIRLEDKDLQLLVREVDPKALALALKGASDGVRHKLFANMSERAAATVNEEIDLLGPQRKSDVEAARLDVLSAMRALEADGKITIARGDDSLVA